MKAPSNRQQMLQDIQAELYSTIAASDVDEVEHYLGMDVPYGERNSKPVMCSMLEGHSCLVKAVAFPPDGKLVASGSFDGTIRLWDTATGATRNRLGLKLNQKAYVVGERRQG
jgi:WD40 repeat protein